MYCQPQPPGIQPVSQLADQSQCRGIQIGDRSQIKDYQAGHLCSDSRLKLWSQAEIEMPSDADQQVISLWLAVGGHGWFILGKRHYTCLRYPGQ